MSKRSNYKELIEDINRDKVEKLICELVKIPSPWFEEEITKFVKKWLGKTGLNPWYHKVSERKICKFEGNNVIAEVGNDNGPTILLNTHMDTVKICDGWKRDSLGAEVEGNRLYGQGALDIKSEVEIGFRNAPYPEVKGYGAYITSKEHKVVKELENSFEELSGQNLF